MLIKCHICSTLLVRTPQPPQSDNTQSGCISISSFGGLGFDVMTDTRVVVRRVLILSPKITAGPTLAKESVENF